MRAGVMCVAPSTGRAASREVPGAEPAHEPHVLRPLRRGGPVEHGAAALPAAEERARRPREQGRGLRGPNR